jgi:hypothetical protein
MSEPNSPSWTERQQIAALERELAPTLDAYNAWVAESDTLTKERDRLAAENARLVGAKPAGQVERETLMDLWRRIDDDQDGDPPSNAALADGLVRMFGEMATRVAELEEELQGAHFESVGGDL